MINQKLLKLNTLYNISYNDNSGNVSSRKIKVKSLYTSSYGNKYVKAWCYLRNEERTFRLDRIIKIAPENHDKKEKSEKIDFKELKENHKSELESEKKEPQQISYSYKTYSKESESKSSSVSDFFGYIFAFFGTAVLLGHLGINVFDNFIGSSIQGSTSASSYTSDIFKDNTYNNYSEKGVKSSEIYILSDKIQRIDNFRVITGIISPLLENMYQSADFNRDRSLQQSELEIFQKKIYKKYNYISNETALRPDQFLKEGGGDCEDWALFTCGLLRYWGIGSAVGILSEDNFSSSHAVALVYKGSILPEKGIYYKFEGDETVYAGIYIPVDYNLVGEYSNAVNENWYLDKIYIPEEIYGDYM